MPQSLSVIVVSFNCWHYLAPCLRSVLSSGYPIKEILVIDNDSKDGTPQKLRSEFPAVRLVENPENIGHARAVNQGFRLVDADRILILDADTELKPGAIARLSEFLDKRPDVCMAAPRAYYPDGTIQESVKNFPSVINGIFGRQSLLTRLFPNNRFSKRYLPKDDLRSSAPFRVGQASAACMLFRKTLLGTVGLWDEGYRGYWVDTDWCKRIEKAGGAIYCVPQAEMIHFEQNRRSYKKRPSRIIDFHAGVYRLYRLHYTRGPLDPRSLAAAVLLAARASMLLAFNFFKKQPPGHKDPLALKK